jgi:cyclohexa-1,5-dienecarbonyl-CoA hydratase
MEAQTIKAPVRLDSLEEGALWHVVLGGGKGNIIDTAMIDVLTEIFRRAASTRELKVILLEGQGPHFSFGASVSEHLPENVGKMLHGFHGLFLAMLESDLPLLAAVRGQCLGGGLELASFANRVFASPDARLGQPEIALGVFPPVASVILSERMGRGRAEDLCLTGRVLGAQEALAAGLVDEIAEDPRAAALAYARGHLLPRSASSLRFGVWAMRHGFGERLRHELKGLEQVYLEELMATHDAVEGIRAFLEKRPPKWENR